MATPSRTGDDQVIINESVAHVLKQFGIINEVFLVSDKSNASFLIGYRDKVWLFADEEEVEDDEGDEGEDY